MQHFFYILTLALMGAVIVAIGIKVSKLQKMVDALFFKIVQLSELYTQASYHNAKACIQKMSGKTDLTDEEKSLLERANLVVKEVEERMSAKKN